MAKSVSKAKVNNGLWVDGTLRLRGKDIPVKHGEMPHFNLKFYPENPRIFSILRADLATPEQEDIQKQLQSLDHVKALVQDIKENGGLIDPVIVKDGTFEVLEGNSRLAAYRLLAIKDPIKWGMMRCTVLPADIPEELIFALLGQYHIKGKKDWAPYEQAGFLYRRYKLHKIKKTDLGKELGLGSKRVGQLIETYEFMLEREITDVSKWSYFDEYLKSNIIKKVREKHQEFDETFVAAVESGDVPRAIDVREKIQKIACGSDRLVAKYAKGEISLEDAMERVEDSGNTDSTVKKVTTFRLWLANADAQEAIRTSEGHTRQKLRFELDKVDSMVHKLCSQIKL